MPPSPSTIMATPPLLADLLNNLPHGVVAYEAIRDGAGQILDYRTVYYNTQALTVLGYTPEQLSQDLLFQRMPYGRASADLLRRVVDDRQTTASPYFNPLLNRWFEIDYRPLGDGFFATFQGTDITQDVRNAQLFDRVLDSVTNGLSVLEAVRDETGAVVDWRYVRVSRAVVADTGLTESELANHTMLELFPGVKQTDYWSAYETAVDTGEPQHFEQHYNYDGFDNYTDNWVTRIDANQIISVYTIINDYKRATLALQEQVQRTENVLNGAINGIFLLETDPADPTQVFTVRSANQASATILGLPTDEMVDRTMDDLFPAYRPLGFHALYTEALRTGQPQRAALDYQDENGLSGCYDVSAVKQGNNQVVLTFMDISDQKRQQQKQEQLVADLKNSNASLERFAYVASHDLQEPLRKIQTFGNLVSTRYGAALPDEGRDMLRRMQSAASRMGTLIQDLLAYSQLATQNGPMEPVDLTAVLVGIQSDLELVIADKQAQVTVPSLPTIRGNAGQLRQLFQNLLTNALKFTKSGIPPRITLFVQPVAADEVPDRVPNRQRRSWVAIDVADNGIGFDETYQERIFQLFERLHGRAEYAGTGIGLAVCLKVAENHGGTIVARSQPGQGATFTMYLPV